MILQEVILAPFSPVVRGEGLGMRGIGHGSHPSPRIGNAVKHLETVSTMQKSLSARVTYGRSHLPDATLGTQTSVFVDRNTPQRCLIGASGRKCLVNLFIEIWKQTTEN